MLDTSIFSFSVNFSKASLSGLFTARIVWYTISLPITRRQILDSSKIKEFADDNFKFDENGRKLSKRVENTVTSNFSFSHSIFKRLVSQGLQKLSLCGNGLTIPEENSLDNTVGKRLTD